MQEKQLSPEESLKLIEGVIAVAKQKIHYSSFYFLLWGILIIAASLSQYFLLQNGWDHESNLVWGIMPIIGIPAVMIHEYRHRKKKDTDNQFNKIYGQLWLGFLITLFITIGISVSNSINPMIFILSLVGLATFVSGAIYRFVPLIVGAIVFWVSAIIFSQFTIENQLLINALAFFVGYVIPGFLLQKKAAN